MIAWRSHMYIRDRTKEEHIFDTCQLNYILYDIIVKIKEQNIKISPEIENELIKSMRQHHKHRLNDLKCSIKDYDSLVQFSNDIQYICNIIKDIRMMDNHYFDKLNGISIKSLDDIKINDRYFWKHGKDSYEIDRLLKEANRLHENYEEMVFQLEQLKNKVD